MKSVQFAKWMTLYLLVFMAGCTSKPAGIGMDAGKEKDSIRVHIVGNLDLPDSALAELKDGNLRYKTGNSVAYTSMAREKAATAQKQKPFAIILCCSDSRVPPEEIFDQGIGDIFVVRTAGEVVDDIGMGSIEYAVEHLGTRLVVVLGHERCGAVTAAVAGGHAPGHIASILEEIQPAVEAVKDKTGDKIENAIHSNIDLIVKAIQTSEPILKEFVEKGELKVVGAYYDLDEGSVVFN